MQNVKFDVTDEVLDFNWLVITREVPCYTVETLLEVEGTYSSVAHSVWSFGFHLLKPRRLKHAQFFLTFMRTKCCIKMTQAKV